MKEHRLTGARYPVSRCQLVWSDDTTGPVSLIVVMVAVIVNAFRAHQSTPNCTFKQTIDISIGCT